MKAGGSGITVTAIGASALLHGALAATALMWPTDPVPAPVVGPIAVELVVMAPSTHEVPTAPTPPSRPSPAPGPAPEPAAAPVVPTPFPVRVQATAEIAQAPPLAPAAGAATPPPPEPSVETPARAEPVEEAPAPKPPEEAAAPQPLEMAAMPQPREETAEAAPAVFDFVPAPRRPAPPPLPKAAPEPAPVEAAKPPAKPAEVTETAGAPSSAAPPEVEAPTQTAALPPAAEGATEAEPAETGPAGGTGVDIGPRFTLGSARNPLPRYPLIARRRGFEGRVVLRVHVGPEGRVRAVAVAESSTHAVLDEAAVAAIERWRFEPARRAGIPVTADIDVPISFKLRD